MRWLRDGTQPGDEVMFIYSGHGSQVRDRHGDELNDQLDECLCPVNTDDPDYWDAGVILDDDIAAWLKGFPKGVRIVLVFDCCHSGTMDRDLKPAGNPGTEVRQKFLVPPLDIQLRSRLCGGRGYVQKRRFGRGKSHFMMHRDADRSLWSWLMSLFRPQRAKPAVPPTLNTVPPGTGMNHAMVSACRDDQTSADAYIENRFNGALTYYLTRELLKNPHGSMASIVELTKRDVFAGGYAQETQLEGPSDLILSPFFSGGGS
jgi:hypothetical protein